MDSILKIAVCTQSLFLLMGNYTQASSTLDADVMVHEVGDSTACLKRLQYALHILSSMEKAGTLVIPLDIECQERSLVWCNSTFHTMQMVMCIDHICIGKNLEPLFCVWSSLIFSKHQKSSVLHEFAKVVVLLMYSSVKERFQMGTKIVMRSSLEMKHVDTLSLEELLIILDLLVDEVPNFLEKIEFNNPKLTWHEWAKKYWLLAPLTAAIAGIKIYISYLATQPSSKPTGTQA